MKMVGTAQMLFCPPYETRPLPAKERGEVNRSELHRDAGVQRGFGAGAVAHGDAAHNGRAGEGPVVIEAELVLPVAIGDPDVDEVRVLRAPEGLGGVEGQTDRLRVELDRGIEN